MKNSQAKRPQNSVKLGDIFQLGSHLLLCGDSTRPEQVETLLNNSKVKLILTDPPYGVGYVENRIKSSKKDHKIIANDHIQSEEEYRDFTTHWLASVKPYLETKNAYYVFNSDRMLFGLHGALKGQDFKLSQLLIWVKTGAVLGRLDYNPQHELIVYGWHGIHEPLKDKDKSVLVAPKPKKNALHPTMKPVSLLRRLILNSTALGATVYDPFLGSGSTLIACEQTKRRCLGVELDPDYCQVIIERFEKVAGVKALKLTP
ncbi:MAG: site-specific DNA-methyltransferase [Patescibacteria group bacterium]|mgnify:CR=1 FL=1